MRGDDATAQSDRAQAVAFLRRLPDWGRFGLYACYACFGLYACSACSAFYAWALGDELPRRLSHLVRERGSGGFRTVCGRLIKMANAEIGIPIPRVPNLCDALIIAPSGAARRDHAQGRSHVNGSYNNGR